MADEAIIDLIKPNFPVYTEDGGGAHTAIEYIGDATTLLNARPIKNEVWGNYIGTVESTEFEEITGTSYATLSVKVTYPFAEAVDQTGKTKGEEIIIRFELEWAVFSRSLYEHPEFAIGAGGLYELTDEDIAAIQLWESNEKVSEKKIYKYVPDPEKPNAYAELSANARMFARGLYLGQENWEDFAPVIRKTTTFLGGLPGESEAGQKDNPPTFEGGPEGYEWKKTADRAIQTNDDFNWDRVEEWTGGKTVLIDKNELFWSPP